MARRTRATAQKSPTKTLATPVQRSAVQGRAGWTKENAALLIHHGYDYPYVCRVTGFPEAVVRANVNARTYRTLIEAAR